MPCSVCRLPEATRDQVNAILRAHAEGAAVEHVSQRTIVEWLASIGHPTSLNRVGHHFRSRHWERA